VVSTNRRVLLIFLDGIGLGEDDPATNPFAAAETPTLHALAGGQPWLQTTPRVSGARSAFAAVDPRMGVPGRPQSASGQAAILTGRNVPALIGEHYGPRPNPPIRALLKEDNLFKQVVARGDSAALLEGYPPRFHEAIARGKRIPSSYQDAALQAGLPLLDETAVATDEAMTVDWTGAAWRDHLGYADAIVRTPREAGRELVALARRYRFSFFPHWLTDQVGHRGGVREGVELLELFDGVMAGALDVWDDDDGLIVITSDHGNLEDLSHGKHTQNDVPLVVIGAGAQAFAQGVTTLADVAPQILVYLYGNER
jgi:hypothetical protein